MANKSVTQGRDNEGGWSATWSAVTESDTGLPAHIPPDVKKITAQVTGDFTTSGAITWEGSLDGTNWGGLSYKNGTAAVATDATVIAFDQLPKFVRPRATAGSSVSMDCALRGSV